MENLDRFVKAQNNGNTYEYALAEIRDGLKRGHWIWFIFPQLKGLGFSYNSQYYGIKDIEEAKSYLAHPILGKRLIEITEALLQLEDSDPFAVMGGSPDDMKLQSCMTLFASISDNNSVFHRVIDKFFNGETDEKTETILQKTVD